MKNHLSQPYIYASISGAQMNLERFSELVAITPTSFGKNKQQKYFWQYKIEAKDANEGLDIAMEHFLQNLLPKAGLIKRYASEMNLCIKVYVVIYNEVHDHSGCFFNGAFIKLLNQLDAELEVNVYH